MKLQRDWGILKYAEFRTMCKYPAGNRATPFSFPVKLPGPDPGKKSWEIILCITSATFRAAFRQRWVHLYWDEKRVKQRWKTGNLRHPFSHIWEQVCVHGICCVFWYRPIFSLYLLMGLRNQGTCHWSHHLRVIISKTLIVPCRDWNHTGVKGPETAKGTRDSCGHQEGFLAVQRGHCVPWHNPGSTAKNCTGLTRLNSRRQLSGASWEGCYIMSFQDKLWTSWSHSGLAFLQASTNQLAGDPRLTLCTYLLQTREVGRNVKTWSKPFLWLSSVQGCFRNAYL